MKLLSLLFLLAPLLISCEAAEDQLPRDCNDIYNTNKKLPSGVYIIYPSGYSSAVQAYCDMDSEGGRWTVFQRRMDGSVNFYRPWAEYKRGFGNAAGEYWLGLDNIHELTWFQDCELMVDMEDFYENKAFIRYASFFISDEFDGYILHVSGFNNTGALFLYPIIISAGDSLSYHGAMKFTTFDKDQDKLSGNCAKKYLGAFWYNKCHYTNPNGVYRWGTDTTLHATGVEWGTWKGVNYSLKSITMKIRPLI
ncbi:microfibril-associated glycoprotein 4-like [Poeciliopsis prolifica]|uniref:microfibril-associated glycoprotein 4-like n=1 Tax=Poeciliopsis prolifica TaxID=188132 RepID=UPI0024143F55|nr:microfibril-associated glycoprotein 4-like [Poeciliopsis prolifica]